MFFLININFLQKIPINFYNIKFFINFIHIIDKICAKGNFMITFSEFVKNLNEDKVKNAPQGKRNAECARCGNKDKAKLYDINAGKAKCKNCGGYLHLVSSDSN